MKEQDQRGQAFTLEGFVASVVVLTAILLALQSVVLTPTTGGAVDQTVQEQLRQEATDILKVSAGNYSDADCPASGGTGSCPDEKSHDLSYIIRHWNGSESERTWANAEGSVRTGYSSEQPLPLDGDLFGDALNGTFASRGYVYNVVIEYRNATDPNRSVTRNLVLRGVPSNDAITTEVTVTLYDNQTLTGPGNPFVTPDCTDVPIEEIHSNRSAVDWGGPGGCYFPIPEAAAFDDDDQDPIGLAPSECAANTAKCEEDEHDDSPIYNVVEIRVIVW